MKRTPLLLAAAAAIVATAVRPERSPERLALLPVRLYAQQNVRPADLVLRNGKIVTVDDAKPEAQAIAINGDTITAIGSNAEIQRYVGVSTRVVDLNGALATPGFIDAHVHFTGVGDAAKNLKLSPATGWNDILTITGHPPHHARPPQCTPRPPPPP